MAKKHLRHTFVKTPTVYQMEATECGAASLAMVLGYFGRFVPLEELRVETGVSRDGCNAKNMRVAAEKYGLSAKGYSKSMEGLLEMKPPCIIHWNFNHFVVYEGIKGGHPYINDPARGRRKLTMEELDNCFTGIVLVFEKTKEFKRGGKRSTIFEFAGERVKGQYGSMLALFAIGLLLVVPGMVVAVSSQIFIDDILSLGNTGWTSAFLLALAATVLIQALLNYLRGDVLEVLKNKMTLLSAHSFIYHMLRLPMSFFDQRYAGDLQQRVENNNNVSTFLSGELADTVLNMFVSAFYLILMLIYAPLLTLIGVAGVVINLLIAHFGGRYISGKAMKLQQENGKLVGTVYSGVTIIDTLKASGTEDQYVSKVLGNYSRYVSTEQHMGKTQEILNALPQIITQASGVTVLMVGACLVIRGDITAGMLVAFTSLLDSFSAPVEKLVNFIQQIQTVKADISCVEDIEKYPLDERYEPTEKEEMEGKLSGRVEIKDISFGYSRLAAPVVEGLSFSLESGSSIAFCGSSGSGKSTVSKLISGMYSPWGGEILFDNVPLRRIPSEILGSSVSCVSQRISLFSGTIKDNLTLWNDGIMEQDIVRAAKDACIHEIITSLPGAYDYRLSEGGSNLSGGERQRLEIARALVTNPALLILDEATSALDPVVEEEIMNNIKRRGCTCIVVAHRLSAIRDCDQIIVMEKGRIVEKESHEELITDNGYYSELIKNI